MSSGTTIGVGVDVDAWGLEEAVGGFWEETVRTVVLPALGMLVAVTRTMARYQTQPVPHFSITTHRILPPAFAVPDCVDVGLIVQQELHHLRVARANGQVQGCRADGNSVHVGATLQQQLGDLDVALDGGSVQRGESVLRMGVGI